MLGVKSRMAHGGGDSFSIVFEDSNGEKGKGGSDDDGDDDCSEKGYESDEESVSEEQDAASSRLSDTG